MMDTIGERIRAARKAKGLTQRELGEKLGIPSQGVSQWENNLRNPKYSTLEKIAGALGTTALELMGEVRPEPQNAIEFFLPIVPPTVTHQDMRLGNNPRTGKVCIFKSERLRRAERLFSLALAPHRPESHFATAVGLTVVWMYPRGQHKDGSYKTTRPDTDNLEKAFKDVMTRLGFWKDDALVAVEHVEKVWRERPGIYVRVWELEE